MSDREPICPMCWAYRHIRQPLVYQPHDHYWECPACHSKTIDPSTDEASILQDLTKPFLIAHDHDKTVASTRKIKRGGSRTGRRRKKPAKVKRWYEV